MNFRYFRPKSVTWWAGIAAIALGGAGLFGVDDPAYGEIGTVLAVLLGTGDGSPAGLIVLGLGIIGIRDKQERG